MTPKQDSKLLSNTGNRRPPNAGKGRPKGTPNKLTTTAKEAFALAFQGMGGAVALEKWAVENQTEFYKLFARLIPTEVAGPDGGPLSVSVKHTYVDPAAR